MARCCIVFLTLVLSAVQVFGMQVPVFIWGAMQKTSMKANPLETVHREEFSHIVDEELKSDPFTVVFIEETLSVEDFSRKDAYGQTLFPFLRSNLRDSYYLPSVEDALRVLNKVGETDSVDHVKLTDNGLSADLETASGKFLFINLNDAREGESRADMLKRHNDFMEEVFKKLQERYSSLIGIYTAHNPSWTVVHSRVRRQANESGDDLVLDGLLLNADAVAYTSGNSSGVLNTVLSSSSVFNATTQTQTTTIGFNDGITLALNFVTDSSYWYFESVVLTKDGASQVLLPLSEVYSPTGYSYTCGDGAFFQANNDTSHTVYFQGLQLQPFFESRNSSSMEYSVEFDCVGYFDTTILASLMIVFFLIAITFYGIMMMMDIRTMDRFDDPKGKTITINPNE